MMYKLVLGEIVSTIQTTKGSNVETIKAIQNVAFTIWDIGDGSYMRELWVHWMQNSGGACLPVQPDQHTDGVSSPATRNVHDLRLGMVDNPVHRAPVDNIE